MGTSEEGRQGSSTEGEIPAANDAAPEAAHASGLGESAPENEDPAPEFAPEEALSAKPQPVVAPMQDGPSPEDESPPAPAAEQAALPLAPAEPSLEGLSEDEATGRRVESLLAEAPDADPEGVQPERGEPAPEPLPDFALDPAPAPAEEHEAAAEAASAEAAAPRVIATIIDESFYHPPRQASAPGQAPIRGRGMDRVGPIVAFDFDGTLTVRDSFTAFLKWREGGGRYHAEMASLAPAALRYLFDRDPGKLKAAAVKRFLAGLPRQVLNSEAMEFATAAAPLLFRPDALRTWRRYRRDGARLIIVTASPENIVAPFARGLGADMLIATQLVFDQEDRVQGSLLGDNCRGAVKAQRIREVLGEDVVLAAAYGDTDGDWEMLEMAEQQFMRLFVGVPGKPAGPG